MQVHSGTCTGKKFHRTRLGIEQRGTGPAFAETHLTFPVLAGEIAQPVDVRLAVGSVHELDSRQVGIVPALVPWHRTPV